MKTYKLGTFADQLLDRQISALVNAANLSPQITIGKPGPPTGITATSGLLSIGLSVTFPRADNVQCEIWAAATNDRSYSTMLGTSIDGTAEHRGLEATAVRYYWARSVSTPDGYLSEWYPASVTEGIRAVTLADPTALLKMLNGDITNDKIVQYLAHGTSLLDVLDTHPMLFDLGAPGTELQATYTEALNSATAQKASIDLLSTDLNAAEGRLSAAEISVNGALAAVNVQASQAEITATYQELHTAALALDAANSAIALKALETSFDITDGVVTTASSELNIVKDRITMRLDNNGNIAGMVMGWTTPDTSEVVFITDVFKIVQPDGSGLKQAFTVGLVNGVTAVGIDGDLVIDGSITARSFAADQFVVGENVAMGANATIDWAQVQGGPNVTHIDENGVYTGFLSADQVNTGLLTVSSRTDSSDGTRYSLLDQGDLTFYKTIAGITTGYKYMKQVLTGSGTTGVAVTVTNLDRVPEVIVSIRDLVAYRPEWALQAQRWEVRIDDNGVVNLGGGSYRFTPIARLTLAAAASSSTINYDLSGYSSNSITTPVYTSPANTTSINAVGKVNSQRGTGTQPTYYYRKVTVTLYYRLQGGSTWISGASTVINNGADFTLDSYNLTKSGLGSGTYEYQITSVYADAGGTFDSGSTGYDYLVNVVNTASAGNLVAINNPSGSNAYSPTGHITLPGFTPQPGYSVYEVNYSASATVNLWASLGGSASAWSKYVSSGGSYSGAATKAWTAATYSTDVAYFCAAAYGTADILADSASATIKTRKAQTNSTTPANALQLATTSFVLSTATVIDNTGIVNWMAVA